MDKLGPAGPCGQGDPFSPGVHCGVVVRGDRVVGEDGHFRAQGNGPLLIGIEQLSG